jgi:putative PIN family toxin of toxin-antitoxin system
MLRVVLDTVVFVRSLLNHHSWWGRLVFEHAADYHLIVSRETVMEVIDVLGRPNLQRLFSTLEERNPATILDFLARAEAVELAVIPTLSRDSKDNIFLATALVGRADYLVSEDRDLLDLGDYEGTQIVTADVFLRILEQLTARPDEPAPSQ